MSLVVKVIGYTKFLGVPSDLLPEVLKDSQDVGSDMARLVECGGRTCYDSYGVGRSSNDYHDHIKQVGHGSVTEHASINFYIDGISRGCSHELVRHRAGTAFSQRSTRFVDESESPWAHHPLIGEFTKHLQSSDEDHLNESIDLVYMIRAVEELCKRSYKDIEHAIEHWLLDVKKIDKVSARKQARGAARGLLGNALTTSMVFTANIRALRNIIEQRASPFADAEIRLLANKLYEGAMLVCPEWFNDYERVECTDGIGYGLVTKYRKI